MSIVILILTHWNIHMVNMGSIYRLTKVVPQTVGQTVGHSLLPYIPRNSNCKRGITSGGGVTKRVLPSETEAPNFARASTQKLASLK